MPPSPMGTYIVVTKPSDITENTCRKGSCEAPKATEVPMTYSGKRCKIDAIFCAVVIFLLNPLAGAGSGICLLFAYRAKEKKNYTRYERFLLISVIVSGLFSFLTIIIFVVLFTMQPSVLRENYNQTDIMESLKEKEKIYQERDLGLFFQDGKLKNEFIKKQKEHKDIYVREMRKIIESSWDLPKMMRHAQNLTHFYDDLFHELWASHKKKAGYYHG